MAYGAVGGLVIEGVVFAGRLIAWQAARHEARERGRRLPSLRRYVDLAADPLVALTRLLLGAGAGWLFHTQVTGVFAAVAVGGSAPALLRQFGAAKSLREVAPDAEPNLVLDQPTRP